ncbi:MAG: hypothetical protein CBC55_05150 [Gammaproteobacteria bacterium TMED95]|nr:MAG: hypothetical protein CBC55_05150 [Gammaproteobacteria bacterium TMED95]|tara:strand:- start:3329 stop:4417 length:1089 start_codon:yes stop_codon:yes gene_type:complete
MSQIVVSVVDIKDEDVKTLWDRFVGMYPETGHHHFSGYLKAIEEAFSHDLICLMASNKTTGEVKGVLPLVGIRSRIFGDSLTSIPFYNYGGPLYDTDVTLKALVSYAKSLKNEGGYRTLQLRCVNADAGDLGLGVETHKACLVLELPDSPSKLGAGNAKKRAKLRSQCRLAERKAEELNCKIEQRFGTSNDLLNDFYSVFSQHMHSLGTPVYGKSFFESVMKHIDSVITVVYWDNKPVACGWLFVHGSRVSIPWASALKSTNPYSVNSYMYYNILSKCIEEGRKTFDFGRSTINAGTYKFKLQWGAEPVQCYWYNDTSDVSPGHSEVHAQQQEKFSLAVKCWKLLPLFVANLVGPPIIKNVP